MQMSETTIRNQAILEDFERLRKQMPFRDTICRLSLEYHIGEDSIRRIVWFERHKGGKTGK